MTWLPTAAIDAVELVKDSSSPFWCSCLAVIAYSVTAMRVASRTTFDLWIAGVARLPLTAQDGRGRIRTGLSLQGRKMARCQREQRWFEWGSRIGNLWKPLKSACHWLM